MEAAYDALLIDVHDAERRLRLRHGDRRERAGAAVLVQQGDEVDVDELVAVQRKEVTGLPPEASRRT